jgi:hypothetical protein
MEESCEIAQCMRYMFVLQNQKLALRPTQSHGEESWQGGLAPSRRISWRSCPRCGPQAVGPGSARGLPTPPRPEPATRSEALMQSMLPWTRILCEIWICTWDRCSDVRLHLVLEKSVASTHIVLALRCGQDRTGQSLETSRHHMRNH